MAEDEAFGRGGREADGASSFVSSSDEEKESAGRARVLQRRGRARVRELAKIVESMLVYTKRLSALETKPVTRKTLEVYAASVREFCNWSGLSADSNVEVLEVDRLLSKFMNLLFPEGHRAWKGEKLLASLPFFFPTFSQLEGTRLARSFRTLKGWSKASPSFFETTAPGSSLERSGRGNVQDPWYAGGCAHTSHVRSLSPTRGNAVTQTFGFPGTDGGWRPKLNDAVVPRGRHREKRNWRGRRYDQSRL